MHSRLILLFLLGLVAARFTPLGIDEFYIKKCEKKIIYTTEHDEKCQMRSLEIEMDTEENKNYVRCVFEEFGYLNGKGEFNQQALLKDYHDAGIKSRDKAVVESYKHCIKNYGYSSNPMKILDCVTKDKDFSGVINARRERNSEWKPDWMVAYCGVRKLFR
uniref:Putative salivary short d7 protein 3 n=1 Tax=Culex tarsalis TaxID=7177 RepID=A0A1Q3FAX8_CULTA